MTRADGTGPLRLWQNASANALYVYPAHKDYGPGTTRWATSSRPTPPISWSRHGSSGSDQPFLDAVAMTLAAFRPDTKAQLVAENLLVPTVQMVLPPLAAERAPRATLYIRAPPRTRPPSSAYNINPARMVSLANSIRPDAIPPQVRIRWSRRISAPRASTSSARGSPSSSSTPPPPSPASGARRPAGAAMAVSAAETRDPNGRKLAFAWRLLQGDPAR